MTSNKELPIGTRISTAYGSFAATEYGTITRNEGGGWYRVQMDAIDGNPSYPLSLNHGARFVIKPVTTYWERNGKYQAIANWLESQVPDSGHAQLTAVELFRAATRLYHDHFNNGCGNDMSGPLGALRWFYDYGDFDLDGTWRRDLDYYAEFLDKHEPQYMTYGDDDDDPFEGERDRWASMHSTIERIMDGVIAAARPSVPEAIAATA